MNLTNHFLVAMPSMQDPNFKGSVVYICEHNDEGAMGIVINLPIEISVGNMLDQIDIERELTPQGSLPALSSRYSTADRYQRTAALSYITESAV